MNERGAVTEEANPNGSIHNIAGICDEERRVVGLMPHPERAASKLLGTDGLGVFRSLLREVLAGAGSSPSAGSSASTGAAHGESEPAGVGVR